MQAHAIEIQHRKKDNVELETRCSQLTTSKTVLDAECLQLKKGKDTVIAELSLQVRQSTRAMVTDLETQLKAAKGTLDQLASTALTVFGLLQTMVTNSSSTPISEDL
uniref:Uncharacterized protein n=1 Tax=Oryza brachyantha TaxID=4533 RepID=J3N6Y2_ORYBR